MDTLLPAYGRDYKSKKDVLAAFNADKDFVLIRWDEPETYANKPQFAKGARIQFRYDRQRKVFIHTV